MASGIQLEELMKNRRRWSETAKAQRPFFLSYSISVQFWGGNIASPTNNDGRNISRSAFAAFSLYSLGGKIDTIDTFLGCGL